MQIEDAYKDYDHFFLTFYQKGIVDELKNKKIYFLENPERNLLKLLKCSFQTFTILLKEKPKVIISTGAGVAIPSIIIGKIFGCKIIFIESFTRIFEHSLSGKISYYFSDVFLVQWKQLQKKYGKKALYKGAII